MELLQKRYASKISGMLSCYDRVIIKGTLPTVCYADGMTNYLFSHNIRIFDYAKFAEPLRDKIRLNAEQLAVKNDLKIEFIRSTKARKEDIVKKNANLEKSGLIYILSAMETCSSYQPWYDKVTKKTFLKSKQAKCIHYYFYFNDPDLGFGYIRIPTWCPFQLQVYINGHNILANKLRLKNIGFHMLDNAFDYIEDFEEAQRLSRSIILDKLMKKIDWLSKLYCPVLKEFEQSYHWSIMQMEYATDIVFKEQKDLKLLYEDLIATAIHTVKPANIATFFSQKIHSNYEGEMGNNYNIRLEGSRIKHSMGPVSIKMYDKYKKILRIETTVNDVSFFKHYRTVEHRDGSKSQQQAPVKKNIFSLVVLAEILQAVNARYLTFISTIEDRTVGKKKLLKITTSKKEKKRNYKGFNFFEKSDQNLLLYIASGEFLINGFRSKDLKKRFKDYSPFKISRILKRLRVLNLIKKVGKTYKYYITKLGEEAIITASKLKEMVIIPQLNYTKAA